MQKQLRHFYYLLYITTVFVFSEFGEFAETIYFRYLWERDLINTESSDSSVWNYNYRLFGSTGSSGDKVKLNNYGSHDGGSWKSYVFLAGQPDPLTFTSGNNLNRYSFNIPGLYIKICISLDLKLKHDL